MIVERVKAGMARAKAEGKHVGRPKMSQHTVMAIRARLSAGASIGATARALKVGVGTVHRIAQEMRSTASAFLDT